MFLYTVVVYYNANSTTQYSAIQYNTIPHHTKTYSSSSKPSISKITKKKKNQGHTLCIIKIQKRAEPKVDESAVKTTRCTKHHTNLYVGESKSFETGPID